MTWSRSRLLLVGLAGLTLLRLVLASVIPLTEDEAYYRLWSLHPRLGYFDHPPMVAWWIWLGRHLAGDTALGVRLMPVLGSALTTLLVVDTVRLLGGTERAAGRAGLWFNATLLIGAAALLATPDAPATVFWSLSVWCLLKARQGPGLSWWLAAGLAAGLATLSKYSALFLAPGVLGWLLSSAPGREQLKRPGPWLAAVAALAVFSLNLAWNAGHDWLSFSKQFGRVAPHQFKPGYVIELLVAQALLLNPLITAFLVRGLGRRGREGVTEQIAPLAWIAAPFCLYLLFHALHARVEAHWPAPLYAGLAAIAALLAEGAVPGSLWARLRAATPVLGLSLSTLALLHLAIPATDFSAADPTSQLRHWPDFAGRIELLRKSQSAGWVGTVGYGTAAQLAAQRRIAAPVLQVTERQRYGFLPPADQPVMIGPGLIVDLDRRIDAASLGACFAVVRPLGTMDRASGRGVSQRYGVYQVEGPRRADLQNCSRVGKMSR